MVPFKMGKKGFFSAIYLCNKNIQQVYISLKATQRLSSICWPFPLVVNNLLQASKAIEHTRVEERGIGRLGGLVC